MRTCLLLLVFARFAAPQPVYDLVLKGGHVIDPKNHLSAVRDVAIGNGKIAAVAPGIPASQARKVVNAAGMCVTPGLVDIHTHGFNGLNGPMLAGGDWSIYPDTFALRRSHHRRRRRLFRPAQLCPVQADRDRPCPHPGAGVPEHPRR